MVTDPWISLVLRKIRGLKINSKTKIPAPRVKRTDQNTSFLKRVVSPLQSYCEKTKEFVLTVSS